MAKAVAVEDDAVEEFCCCEPGKKNVVQNCAPVSAGMRSINA